MRTKIAAAAVLLALALGLPNQTTLACESGAFGKDCSSRRTGVKGWIELHRPDGEVVHIQVDQIVLVMSATNTSANKLAQSRVQLANGFADVLESVDEVMKAIMNDDSIG